MGIQIAGGGGSRKPPPPAPDLKVGQPVEINPEHREAGAVDQEFFVGGPVFVEESRYESGAGMPFTRVVNSGGQVRGYPSHQLKLQSAPLAGAMVPGPTLPVVGAVVGATEEARGMFQDARKFFGEEGAQVASINDRHVATVVNASGEQKSYNLSLLQNVTSRVPSWQDCPPETTAELEKGLERWGLGPEQLKPLFERAPETAGAANLALQALQQEGGLELVNRFLREQREDAFPRAQRGLALVRDLELSAGDQRWMDEVMSWDSSYAGDRLMLETILGLPEAERAPAAELLKSLMLGPHSHGAAADHARSAVRVVDLLTEMSPDGSLIELGRLYRDFESGMPGFQAGSSMSQFRASGLDNPELRAGWQRYRELGMDSLQALAGTRLESESPAPALLHELAQRGSYAKAYLLAVDYALLTADRPPNQSLEDRLELVLCLAHLAGERPEEDRRAFFSLLEEAWPNHEAMADRLHGLEPTVAAKRAGTPLKTLNTALQHASPGETALEAAHRLLSLDEVLPASLSAKAVEQTFAWLSRQPPEDQPAYQEALIARLERGRSVVEAGADLTRAVQGRPPEERVPSCLRTLTVLAASLPQEDLERAYDWVYAQRSQSYPELAARLCAELSLTGSLERAMECLEKPAGGIQEVSGGVMVGGVRIKRRVQ